MSRSSSSHDDDDDDDDDDDVVVSIDYGEGTALIHAAGEGHLDRVRDELARDPSKLACCNQYGQTALIQAATSGHCHIVEFLLQTAGQHSTIGGNIMVMTTQWGSTALHKAAEGNHVEIVELLLLGNYWTRAESGKDVSCADVVNIADGRGATPLMVAASRGNVEIASLLLRHGAKVNVCNHLNRSPLVIAALKAHLDMILLLVDNGADITITANSEGGGKQRHQLPAPTVAVHQDVAWLMEHRRSNHHDQARKLFGKNIFHIATGSDREDIVHTFIRNGVDVNSFRDDVTPLMIAAQCCHRTILQLLLDNGAYVNAKSSTGGSALWRTMRNSYSIHRPEVVRLLLEHGADPNVRDSQEGHTPLTLAAKNGHADLFRYLMDAGANTTTRDALDCSARTTLTDVVDGDYLDVFLLLAQCRGFNSCVVSSNGTTALTKAANGRRELTYTLLLLQQGAQASLVSMLI